MAGPTPFIGSTTAIERSVYQLEAWLLSQAIHVPDGWVQACVSWLIDEHGGLQACANLTQSEWCRLIYEQWLHSDLHQLGCPVLPARPTGTNQSMAMKLEGELCLQVIGLFNISDSYYGQLRRHEGNLSEDLPCLETPAGTDWMDNLDRTQMTQAHSRYGSDSQVTTPTSKTFSLFLTDGVTQVKAIELGTLSRRRGSLSLCHDELLRKLQPGVKVRIRGPLTLRSNVLMLPAGAILTLSNPQLEVLGGEVDELLENRYSSPMYQLGVLLARKLSLPVPEDGALPTWFPRIFKPSPQTENIPPASSHTTASTVTAPPQINGSSRSDSLLTTSCSAQATSAPSATFEPWDNEDDILISEAAESLEQQISRFSATLTPMVYTLKNSSQHLHQLQPVPESSNVNDSRDSDISLEVDPDVLASAYDEIDNAMGPFAPTEDCLPTSKPSSSILHTSKPSLHQLTLSAPSTSSSSVLHLKHDSGEAKTSKPALCSNPTSFDLSRNASTSDTCGPPFAKRKPWEGSPMSKNNPTPDAQDFEMKPLHDQVFHPFCYIKDMYDELVRNGSTINLVPRRRVYTVRAMLISLLSTLEHHQGTRWTLAARLADGSATVDVDIASDLLTEWIGLTAAESESLRQLSRVDVTGASTIATQEAQKHRQRLRTALTNFQAHLANLSGLFDITPPPPSTSLKPPDSSDDKPVRPVLVAYRPLSVDWLKELVQRVTVRWGFNQLE